MLIYSIDVFGLKNIVFGLVQSQSSGNLTSIRSSWHGFIRRKDLIFRAERLFRKADQLDVVQNIQ